MALVVLGCSASGASQGNGVGSTSGAGAGSGGTVALGSGGGSAGTSSVNVGGAAGSGSSLPPPWQYYSSDSELAYKDSALGADVKDQFPATSASDGAPTLVYPLAQSMHPMNVGDIVFQWQRGRSENTVFRIDAVGGGQTFRFFVSCNDAGNGKSDECIYVMPESEWLDLGGRFKGASIELSIAGSYAGAATTAQSASSTIDFSPEAVLGGLYYWSQTKSGIMRATFGSKRAELFIAPNSPTNDYACAGCHSVSRNGKVIAFTAQASRDYPGMGIQFAPTATPDQPYVAPTKGISPAGAGYPRTPGQEEPQDAFGQNVALNADGTIAAVNGARFDGVPPGEEWFELRDATTGQTLTTPTNLPATWIIGDPLFGPNQLPILPEWSPDGTSIVATMMNRQSGCGWTFFSCQSGLTVLSIANNTISAVKPLVSFAPGDAMYHFYPSYSPDGKYVAFASAPNVTTESGSSDNRNAVLRLVPATGGPYTCPGPSCYELTLGTGYTPEQATAGAGLGSTWPKFTPFAQKSGNLLFVSFTSRRDYGFLSKGRAQLWMFAVDVTKLGNGDPSSAPIWLPHQDLTDESFTPYWTEVLPCEFDPQGGCQGCVGSEQCVAGPNNQCQCAVVVK